LMLAALLLLILTGGIAFWSSGIKKQSNDVSQSLTPKIIGKAELTIDFGNGKKRVFEGDIVERETLVGVLIQASKAGNFSYKLDGGDNLAIVSLWDISQGEKNFTAKAGKSWHWYLNDKKLNKSLNEIILKNGDKILIRYE